MNSMSSLDLKLLPALPQAVIRLNELVQDSSHSFKDLADVLAVEPSLTSKVLRLANSSYYSIPGGVADIQKAIRFLGTNTLIQLVLGISVVGTLKFKGTSHFDSIAFWKHSMSVAVASEWIAKRNHFERSRELFTCGLLHDIGKLALIILNPDHFSKVMDEIQREPCSFIAAERRFHNSDDQVKPHDVIGYELATAWNLPKILQSTIRNHHCTESEIIQIQKQFDAQDLNAIRFVRAANHLTHIFGIGNSGSNKTEQLDLSVLHAVRLEAGDMASIEHDVREAYFQAEGLLSAFI